MDCAAYNHTTIRTTRTSRSRWRGRSLIDVFESEFRDRPLEYYRKVIEGGGVTIDGKTADRTTSLKNGERISHTLHRHEPPVAADPVGVVHEDGRHDCHQQAGRVSLFTLLGGTTTIPSRRL